MLLILFSQLLKRLQPGQFFQYYDSVHTVLPPAVHISLFNIYNITTEE